jgi:hypothetical protein
VSREHCPERTILWEIYRMCLIESLVLSFRFPFYAENKL